MPEAYIIDAARTPVGRRRGALAAAHPVDLAAHVIGALVERNGVDPASVDDVILGCLDNIEPVHRGVSRTLAFLEDHRGFHLFVCAGPHRLNHNPM